MSAPWSRLLLVGLCVAAGPMASAQESSADSAASLQITRIVDMAQARAAHQATVLQSGDILISGGCTGRCDSNLASAELFDATANAFRPAAAMATARDSHAAIRLADGRVLIAGGWSQGQVTRSAELYEPDANRFASAGNTLVARAAPAVARLADGRVLIAGGQSGAFAPLDSAELFDPAAPSFSLVASMTVPRVGHVAVALADGRVLLVGGRQARRGDILSSAEIFDPSTGRFRATGSMAVPRHKHAAARLPDGRVLVIGGSDVRDQGGRYRSTELYDPTTGKFLAGPDMNWPRFKLPDAVATLPSGALLIAGGSARMEIYDPATTAFAVVPGELETAREFATASVLANGDVLVAGGYDDRIQTAAFAWRVRGLAPK